MKSPNPIAAVPPPASSENLFAQAVRGLTRYAARRSPHALAERLEEEWLADLAARQGLFAQLRFALGCCWASRIIAHDPISFGATATAAAGGSGTVVFGAHDPSFFSRRSTVIIIILCLHAAAIYGFASGFVQNVMIQVIPRSSKAVVLDPQVVDVAPLKPLRYVLPTPTRPSAPHIPDLALSPLVMPNGENPVTPFSQDLVPATQGSAVTRVVGGPGSGFPNTRDFYPAAAIRAEESGATAVRVCVDREGRLTSDPVVVGSSGYGRLDGGALALARAASGHYRSTTENGSPVVGCYAFRIRFELQSVHQ